MKIELHNAFNKVFLTIEYDVRNSWIHNRWSGYQTPENVMRGANSCLEILQQYKCKKLLNDNILVVGPWNHSTDWIANNWTPRAIKAGLTHFANIVSPEAMARTSALDMITKVSDSFRMQIFDDIEAAKKWLQQTDAHVD